jgi:hypothetical protein
MISKISAVSCVTLALISGGANAAVSFTDGILTANLISDNFSAVLGGGTVAQGAGLYALELERSTDILVPNPPPIPGSIAINGWGRTSIAFGTAAGSNPTNFVASWNLVAAPGYRIDSLLFSASGVYVTANGSVKHQTTLTNGSSSVTSGVGTGSAVAGTWVSNTGPLGTGSVASIASVDLNVLLTAQRNAFGSSAIVGLDDAGLTGFGAETFSGPTLYVTVTAIPEPGEWAMMIAGLSVVGLMARRRRVR